MMIGMLQTSCPHCGTTADTNPNRTSVVGYPPPPPVGQCACGKTKIKVAS